MSSQSPESPPKEFKLGPLTEAEIEELRADKRNLLQRLRELHAQETPEEIEAWKNASSKRSRSKAKPKPEMGSGEVSTK